VLENLAARRGPATGECFERIFRGSLDRAAILDVRPRQQKERLFAAKEEVWRNFGYTHEYLERMKSQSFWDGEYAKVPEIDAALARSR
jgi:hypothetical protein